MMVVMLQVMALDESCLACGPGDQDQGPVMTREARDEAFHRNYKRYVFSSDRRLDNEDSDRGIAHSSPGKSIG